MPKCSKKTCTREAGPKFKQCQGCRHSGRKSERKKKTAEALAKEGLLKCSHKTCSRKAEPQFKTCQKCRDSGKKSDRKRKRAIAEVVSKEGYRYCTKCFREQPLEQFMPAINRSTKLTGRCASCRVIFSKSIKSETSKSGQCRKIWKKWCNSHACLHCGTMDCIEADHIDRATKTRNCSDYTWWAWNGGVEALTKELAKVRPLCCFCHRIHSRGQRSISKNPSVMKKRLYVEAIKMRIGCCQVCQRKVTPETFCGFDFNHLDVKNKRDSISKMVTSYSLMNFFKYIDSETEICRLECANCHLKFTKNQKKEMTSKIAALARQGSLCELNNNSANRQSQIPYQNAVTR